MHLAQNNHLQVAYLGWQNPLPFHGEISEDFVSKRKKIINTKDKWKFLPDLLIYFDGNKRPVQNPIPLCLWDVRGMAWKSKSQSNWERLECQSGVTY